MVWLPPARRGGLLYDQYPEMSLIKNLSEQIKGRIYLADTENNLSAVYSWMSGESEMIRLPHSAAHQLPFVIHTKEQRTL